MPLSASTCEGSAGTHEYHRLTLHRELLANARVAKASAQERRLAGRAHALRYIAALASCLAAVALWGTVYPVYGSAMRMLDPITIGTIRNAIMALVVVPALFVVEGPSAFRMTRAELMRAALIGFIGIAGFGIFTFLGEHLAGTGSNASKLTAVYAMAVMILWEVGGSIRSGRLPRGRDLTLVCTAYAGLTLMISGGGITGLLAPRGLAAGALVLTGVACWMWYTVLFRKFPTWSVLRFSAVTIALGTTGFALIDAVLIACHALPVPSIRAVTAATPACLYLGIAAGALPFLLWNSSARRLTPINALMFMSVGTAVTVVISDHLAGSGVNAEAMILGGVAMLLAIGNYSLLQYRSGMHEGTARATVVRPIGATYRAVGQ